VSVVVGDDRSGRHSGALQSSEEVVAVLFGARIAPTYYQR
jgi:hypothetical protein